MTESHQEEQMGRVEKVASQAVEIFNKLPMAYKRLITFYDWLMVLGGLKAATDITFAGETWNEADFKVLTDVVESAGLRISELHVQTSPVGITFRSGFLYNPTALAAQTANSALIPPYRTTQTIDEYIREAATQGVHNGIIHGKIFSFPESAIRDFVQSSDGNRSNDDRVTLETGGETYWVYPPMQDDVRQRESAKQAFFDQLLPLPKIQHIFDSQELKQSDAEWTQRLPAFMRRG